MKQAVYFEEISHKTYAEVWDYQEALLQQKVAAKRAAACNGTGIAAAVHPHHLLFAHHAPVYTLGKNGKAEHVLLSATQLAEKGIEYFHINRGGDITYHGPGQLVGYPILDLEKFKTDLGWYLRSLEEVFIVTLAEYGLQGERSAGETGVWLDPLVKGKERKICALGIRCSRWVTMHGFAFNVNTDLRYFDYIIPCGIQNKQVTSLEKELGNPVPMEEVAEKVKRNFERIFDVTLLQPVTAEL